MYYVQKRDITAIGGYRTVKHCDTQPEALQAARDFDTIRDGEPAGFTRVLTAKEYDKWHETIVMPFYRRG